jgi:flavorubredoxin
MPTAISTASAEAEPAAPSREVPRFPREVAPGFFWFSSCLDLSVRGKPLHNHNSCFLVVGSDATVLVDTGMPYGWAEIRAQLTDVLAGRPLDYVFATHPEAPHVGNAGPLLRTWPTARLCGDLRNYHLFYPEFRDRFHHMRPGDALNLGDRSLIAVPAIVHDLVNTLWAYDTGQRILFVSDGYPYTHAHSADQCAMTAEELPESPKVEDTGPVIEGALGWTRHVDAELTIRELEDFLVRYPSDIIAPAHGGVITHPPAITEVFKAGLRRVNWWTQ